MPIEGFNSRLDELQAAILSYKLSCLDEDNEKRRHLADIYRWDLDDETPVRLPVEKPWAHHVYHLFVVRTKEREALELVSEVARASAPSSITRRPSISRRSTSVSDTRKALSRRPRGRLPRYSPSPSIRRMKEEEVVAVAAAIKAYLRPMKCLHLFSDWKWTGPADPVVSLCEHLAPAGVDVSLAFREAPGRLQGEDGGQGGRASAECPRAGLPAEPLFFPSGLALRYPGHPSPRRWRQASTSSTPSHPRSRLGGALPVRPQNAARPRQDGP